MKSYHILDCDEQQRIADLLYGYYIGISAEKRISHFWNHLTRDETLQLMSIPNSPLTQWFYGLKLRVRDVSFTLYDRDTSMEIHKDEPPVVAKINFPVFNTQGTHNVWFDDNLREIDRVECVKPIVLRSNILHTVEMGENPVYPRLQFSFCFYNEPLHLLG